MTDKKIYSIIITLLILAIINIPVKAKNVKKDPIVIDGESASVIGSMPSAGTVVSVSDFEKQLELIEILYQQKKIDRKTYNLRKEILLELIRAKHLETRKYDIADDYYKQKQENLNLYTANQIKKTSSEIKPQEISNIEKPVVKVSMPTTTTKIYQPEKPDCKYVPVHYQSNTYYQTREDTLDDLKAKLDMVETLFKDKKINSSTYYVKKEYILKAIKKIEKEKLNSGIN